MILSFFSWQELPNIFKYTKLFVLILIPNLCKNKIYKFSWIKPYQDNPDMTFLVVFTLYTMLWWATLQNLVITFTPTTNSFKSINWSLMSCDGMNRFHRHSVMVSNAVLNLKLNKQLDIMEVFWNPTCESISGKLPQTYFQVK